MLCVSKRKQGAGGGKRGSGFTCWQSGLITEGGRITCHKSLRRIFHSSALNSNISFSRRSTQRVESLTVTLYFWFSAFIGVSNFTSSDFRHKNAIFSGKFVIENSQPSRPFRNYFLNASYLSLRKSLRFFPFLFRRPSSVGK